MSAILESNLHSMTPSFDQIPVVDLAPLLDNTDPEGVARQIGLICENVGFLYVRNHGVPAALIDEMYRLAAAFFALPMEEKMALEISKSGPALRGYIPPYAENVNPGVSRDFKECYDMGRATNHVSPFFGPNPYPEKLPRFRIVAEQYHREMMNLSRMLARAIALSLDLPGDYFQRLQRQPITVQRLLHYPPQSGRISENEMGVGAHTDYGFLTILAQDDSGGLQVRNRDGMWVGAPPIEDTFIVNIGDLVQTFTNDRYTSTLHRVINTSGRERYSLPFFLDLDFDALVSVVPTCRSRPVKYRPYTCGEHKYRRYVDSFVHLAGTETTWYRV